MATSDDGGFESRIGKGTKVSGTLSFRAPVKIEGEAEGDITGDEIVIAEGAVVNAKLSATRLTVAGRLNGEATARERIELLPSARVQCTLTTPSLVLREGAQFQGDCKMPASAKLVQPSVPAQPSLSP
ncbi:MAG TPA: polymer-forming cytoskeletal protein [Candidatus Binataceae bacterium]|jgi:cytoskeletal protein CcmA (bactofilin family)|nr:polymer-forming cytoskeletal protein [Candidatus Binataceae bacterium]